MNRLLFTILLFISFLCKSQTYFQYIQWQNTIGGSSTDVFKSLDKTNDGGYILGGFSSSDISADKSENSKGGYDYWILKLNSDGNIEWQRTLGGDANDELTGIRQTGDGGYIVGGTSYSAISGDKTENNKDGSGDFWILKLDVLGNIQWQNTIGGSSGEVLTDIELTRDGGYILGGYTDSDISYDKTEDSRSIDYWIIKLNAAGNIQWQKTLGGDGPDNLWSVHQTPDGGYILGGDSYSNISGNKTENMIGYEDYWIIKTDSIGNIQWQNTIGGSSVERLVSILPVQNDGYILSGHSGSGISGDKTENNRFFCDDYWVLRLNNAGNIVWQKTIGGDQCDQYPDVQLTSDGGFILGGGSQSGKTGDKTEDTRGEMDYWVVKLAPTGEIEWQKTLGGISGDLMYAVSTIDNDDYILGGLSNSNSSGDKIENTQGGNYNDYWVVKLHVVDSLNSINGKVFSDENSNCIQESVETGASNVILKTEPDNFFGISDTIGKYVILTDTGTYKVKQITPAILKPFLDGGLVCPNSGYHTVSFSEYGQDTTEINFANYEKQCPYLQVQLTQSRMRRCFDNNASIKYCNIGNVDTNNVQIIITFPDYVSFVSASNPNYTIIGKKILFNIGTLRANECGTIHLVTHVDCIEGITGLTQCIKAQILPRNECVNRLLPDYALWDKSEVTVDGVCTGNTVRFVIKNTGQNMSDSSAYRIYKNAVLALPARFKLLAGDSLVINVSATGHTYRLEADQTLHFPSPSQPSITVENCGTGMASRGFVNQQPQDRSEQNIEKNCLEIRDSYDPNDKSVSPSGVGANKLVPHKIPLDFLIRFQNTGTDTAYKVVITDTLNQNLDLATLEFGASSHPYKIEFTGSGKPILKFTFDKINLVDSFTNEPKSHGFISFKITPYDSIPNGTIVKNNADIYFDFNLPVKTNTTQVSIDDRLPTGATLNLVTSVTQKNTVYEAIHVYPNPFTQTADFELLYNTNATQLFIYDVNGELIVQENIAGKTMFQLQRANLSNGMYFYNIQNKDGEIIGRGKLVLQ